MESEYQGVQEPNHDREAQAVVFDDGLVLVDFFPVAIAYLNETHNVQADVLPVDVNDP